VDAEPTVILLPGAGGFSATWSQVQQDLTQQRTCAFDPAGWGWSDASTVARTLRQDAFDMHLALERGNVSKPLVLVGHSIGGLVARLYAQRYGEEVVALVLVDATHEDSRQFNTRVNRWVRLRELSTGKAVPAPSVGAPASANPSDDFLAEELQDLHNTRRLKSATFDDLPLFVLYALKREQPPGTSAEFWTELRAERDAQATDLVRLSRRGTLVRAEQSGHNIHTDEPDLVARVIRDAIVAAEAVTGQK
jgi:pimeloyl-ACP methyl ester carboxylesterase